MKDPQKFWDRLAKKYAKRPIKDMQSYEKTLERTKAHLSRQDRVLEIGCGTGSTALLLADSVKHITASDISEEMIRIARDKAEAEKAEKLTFIRATLSDGNLDKGPYDAVLAFNFLHLAEDTPKALRRIDELLKPGGLFISKTVCLAQASVVLRPLIFIMQKLGFAPFVRFLRVSELDDLIRAEKFEIIETGDYPASPPSRFVVARKK